MDWIQWSFAPGYLGQGARARVLWMDEKPNSPQEMSSQSSHSSWPFAWELLVVPLHQGWTRLYKQDRNVDQCRHRCTDNVSRGFADTQLHPIATYPDHLQPYLSDYDLTWFNMKLFQRIPLPAFAGVTVCNKNGQPLKHRLQTVYSFRYTIKCNKLINMFFLQSLKPKTSKTPFALVTDRKTIHRPPCFADWRAHRTRSWRITMSSSQLWQFFCSHIVAWLHDTSKVYVLWIEAVLLSLI